MLRVPITCKYKIIGEVLVDLFSNRRRNYKHNISLIDLVHRHARLEMHQYEAQPKILYSIVLTRLLKMKDVENLKSQDDKVH
jgi:hypothetical protein